MRCDSPPESEGPGRSSVRYPRPTSSRKRRRSLERQLLHEARGRVDGHPRHLDDRLPLLDDLIRAASPGDDVADGHRPALGAQALALARRARLVAEVAQVVLAHALGGGLLEAAHEHGDDSLEARLVGAAAPALAPADAHRLVARAIEEHLLQVAGEVLPGLVERHLEAVRERLDHPEGPAAPALQRVRPGLDRALPDAFGRVGHHQVGVHLRPGAQAVALLAHPERVVEGEAVRSQLREADAVHRAGEVLAVHRVRLPLLGQGGERVQHALALPQRGLDGVDQPAVGFAPLDHQAVDHDLDVVLSLLVQLDVLVERTDGPVDARPREPPLARVGQHFLVLALALLDERRQQGEPGALGQPGQLVGDLLRALLADAAAADGAVLLAHRGEEHAQVVVDLDGDGGRQAPDHVVVRLLHLPEELAGVGGERFDVAPLPLGIQGVEGKRALARPRDAGEHHQPLLRDLQGDALEVVLTGTLDEDLFGLHRDRAG